MSIPDHLTRVAPVIRAAASDLREAARFAELRADADEPGASRIGAIGSAILPTPLSGRHEASADSAASFAAVLLTHATERENGTDSYLDDIRKHDRETLERATDGDAFLWITNPCGSDLYRLPDARKSVHPIHLAEGTAQPLQGADAYAATACNLAAAVRYRARGTCHVRLAVIGVRSTVTSPGARFTALGVKDPARFLRDLARLIGDGVNLAANRALGVSKSPGVPGIDGLEAYWPARTSARPAARPLATAA